MLLLQPWFLLLLPVVAWPWIGKGAARDRGQALLRGVVLALVVLSLARPCTPFGGGRVRVGPRL